MALGLAWKPEGSLTLSFCCSSSKFNMLTSKYSLLAFCLQVSMQRWPPMTVPWVRSAKEHLLKFKWMEVHDLAEGTRTQCSTHIPVTQSIALAQERHRVLQRSWKAFLLRRKWIKNWKYCSNLSLTQIQRMKLLKNKFFLSPESFSVRLSSSRGEDHRQCVNRPAVGISSPRFPQDAFRVSNGHSRDDSEMGAWQVN